MEQGYEKIGREILAAARNELYMNLPYLDAALCALRFTPGEGTTMFTAADGEALYYNGNYLADRFLRSRTYVNRLYLHTVLHCLLRHLYKKRGRDSALWDLSCDIAVESILDGMDYPCLAARTALPLRQKTYGELRQELKVLTAEGVYRQLLRRRLPEYELARLQKEFFADDHDMHYHLLPLNDVLFRDTNPVPMKAALGMMGRIKPIVRPPLGAPSPELTEEVRKTLASYGLV